MCEARRGGKGSPCPSQASPAPTSSPPPQASPVIPYLTLPQTSLTCPPPLHPSPHNPHLTPTSPQPTQASPSPTDHPAPPHLSTRTLLIITPPAVGHLDPGCILHQVAGAVVGDAIGTTHTCSEEDILLKKVGRLVGQSD